jgi:hypothetical protein
MLLPLKILVQGFKAVGECCELAKLLDSLTAQNEIDIRIIKTILKEGSGPQITPNSYKITHAFTTQNIRESL